MYLNTCDGLHEQIFGGIHMEPYGHLGVKDKSDLNLVLQPEIDQC